MGVLLYDIQVMEEQIDGQGNVQKEWEKSLPHHDVIKEDFKKQFEACDIKQAFDGDLSMFIEKVWMTVFRDREQHTIARIHVAAKPKFRMNEHFRSRVFEELDGQMSDGFGESMDMSLIPGTRDYRYKL